MKKTLSVLVVLVLLLALSTAALAAGTTMYAVKDGVAVYTEKDTGSTVAKTLSKGAEVQAESAGDGWYSIEGGYVQADNLSTTKPPCEHSWGEWSESKPASCTAKGERTRTCSLCGSTETGEIDMLPHTFGEWSESKAATCTAKGERTHSCSVCGATETQETDMLPHTFGDWKVQKEATCTAEGVMFRTCSTCSKEETKAIEKKPHSFGDWIVRRAATCTKEGERYHLCKACGLEQTMPIEKIPHSYGGWVVLRDPTCTEKGLKARWCQVCGFESTREIDKLPHNYGDWAVTVEATDHSAGEMIRICESCGKQQTRSFDPEGTLRRGAKGSDVREIQQLLYEQGYLKAKGVDGSFGGGTEKAIKAFQKDQGINPDGVAWPETIRRLHHDYGDWELVTPLGRNTDGELARVCRECGYTQHKVFPAGPSFVRRDKDSGIKAVQKMLNALGYDCGKVDGSFGGKVERAWESFVLEHGIDPELDKLRPADLDALTNAWLEFLPEEDWMGQGDKDAAVNLMLTVTQTGEEKGFLTYEWTLSNLGSSKARFVTLLLGCDENHDFQGDNVVLVLDNARLKADGDNRLTGSFTIAADWAQGAGFSFCALATEDETGAVWSSNTVHVDA